MTVSPIDDLVVEEGTTIQLPWCSVEVEPDFWIKARKARRSKPQPKPLVPSSSPQSSSNPEPLSSTNHVPTASEIRVIDYHDLMNQSPTHDSTTTASVQPGSPIPGPTPSSPPVAATPTSPIATVTRSHPSEAPTSPTPTAVPAPKSWAELLKSKAKSAPGGPANKHGFTGSQANESGVHPAGSVMNGSTHGSTGVAQGALTNGFQRFKSLSQLLEDYQLSFRRTLIQPRGLINNGNMCFMNSILQSLVYCPPFYNLLCTIGNQVAHSFHSTTPLMDSLVAFVKEFRVITSPATLDASEKVGDSMVPEPVYNALRSLKKFDSMKGRQEDAQEFMGYLLDGLHEEMLTIIRDSDAGEHGSTSADNSEDQGWVEVGKKNRIATTRTLTLHPSPVTHIFGGQLRSVLRCPGAKDSITFEPFQSLLLDISPAHVESVEDALNLLVQPELLEEYANPSGYPVQATKQLLLESAPSVLILHINRFVYTSTGGAQKLQKPISYHHQLALKPSLFGPASRPAQPLVYNLAAVVYHHGRHLSGGHYTCDVLQANDQWLNIDDVTIQQIPPEQVVTQGYEDRLPYVLFYVQNSTT
ncbi:hypothetical protein IWQ62_004481 [Dispira parvispora]|uniref:Ubiquitin carboxyl-terminal hydrolase n=1 Tax=Dispira parvispora TaxID=1520584 RepID=A0A9W8ALU4_9FUNG|nr:hypothetical protein IWQ62_004481 [Dispira parvispora]